MTRLPLSLSSQPQTTATTTTTVTVASTTYVEYKKGRTFPRVSKYDQAASVPAKVKVANRKLHFIYYNRYCEFVTEVNL
jgi:hypothetical protein